MKLVKYFSALFVILILSGCNGIQPTYNNQSTDYVLARHIVVKSKYHAKEIIRRLDESSNPYTTFIQIAQNESEGPSKTTGGKLGWFGAMKMVPTFDKAVFNMKVGTYSKSPVKTVFGYHIIYLEKRLTQQQFRQLQFKYRQKELDRIASYEVNYLKEHNKLLKEIPKRLETYIQPYNKKGPCKVWMGYTERNAYFKEDSYKIAWDGKCKNGYASGLGREIESADMIDQWGIAIYKKGKPTYYITKDNLSDILFEGIQDVRNHDRIGVNTIIKETNNGIHIKMISGVNDDEKHIGWHSYTSPFWNGSYQYIKNYLNYRYSYTDNTQNDAQKMDFTFVIKNKDNISNGWTIAKQKKSTSFITGEFINGKFKPFKLPQSYNYKADKILREVKKASQKGYAAQEQAQKVKKQYLKRVCKKSVKVDWMDNDDYKDICHPKQEIIIMKKINAKLQKISEEKIARLEKQNYEEQEQKKAQYKQESLRLERERLAEIKRHNSRIEAQEGSRQFQQSLDSLNKQIRNMTPKTYNVNVFHY